MIKALTQSKRNSGMQNNPALERRSRKGDQNASCPLDKTKLISCDLSHLKSTARAKLPLLGNFKLVQPNWVGSGPVRADQEKPNSVIRQAPPSW